VGTTLGPELCVKHCVFGVLRHTALTLAAGQVQERRPCATQPGAPEAVHRQPSQPSGGLPAFPRPDPNLHWAVTVGGHS
jgi:hypothetical protein